MTWCRRLVCGFLLGGLLWGFSLSPAAAQPTHTLQIQDGTVYVDGQPLSEDQLPDSLNLEGVTAQYRFLGIRRPVIELNGRLFAVDNGLRPVTEEEVQEERASVILQGGTLQSSSHRGAFDRQRTGHRQYLNDIQRSSRDLYERLLRERQMEQEARELARAIRLVPEGPDRQTKIDSLRDMLGEMFALKQENRRREIQHLQRQIREIQESIQKRAEMRDLMIDRRLRQLVDSTRGR